MDEEYFSSLFSQMHKIVIPEYEYRSHRDATDDIIEQLQRARFPIPKQYHEYTIPEDVLDGVARAFADHIYHRNHFHIDANCRIEEFKLAFHVPRMARVVIPQTTYTNLKEANQHMSDQLQHAKYPMPQRFHDHMEPAAVLDSVNRHFTVWMYRQKRIETRPNATQPAREVNPRKPSTPSTQPDAREVNPAKQSIPSNDIHAQTGKTSYVYKDPRYTGGGRWSLSMTWRAPKETPPGASSSNSATVETTKVQVPGAYVNAERVKANVLRAKAMLQGKSEQAGTENLPKVVAPSNTTDESSNATVSHTKVTKTPQSTAKPRHEYRQAPHATGLDQSESEVFDLSHVRGGPHISLVTDTIAPLPKKKKTMNNSDSSFSTDYDSQYEALDDTESQDSSLDNIKYSKRKRQPTRDHSIRGLSQRLSLLSILDSQVFTTNNVPVKLVVYVKDNGDGFKLHRRNNEIRFSLGKYPIRVNFYDKSILLSQLITFLYGYIDNPPRSRGKYSKVIATFTESFDESFPDFKWGNPKNSTYVPLEYLRTWVRGLGAEKVVDALVTFCTRYKTVADAYLAVLA
ncbi:hypothetical protein OPT61_g2731 [Boeremia exigua]|uniref:Uncharacterized protein n=1 Tax=Boeremia exigua TaxID=749465 RepID=A0ACC2IKF8_9PLEO|nr:hypothetical protein OPT61_g2731 [Boeremia exigua]